MSNEGQHGRGDDGKKKGFLSGGDQCVAMSRYRAWTEAKLQSVMLFSISIILTALMSRDSRA